MLGINRKKIIKVKKAPRQGIEPWFSDLESDVLTIERPRISYPLFLLFHFIVTQIHQFHTLHAR